MSIKPEGKLRMVPLPENEVAEEFVTENETRYFVAWYDVPLKVIGVCPVLLSVAVIENPSA